MTTATTVTVRSAKATGPVSADTFPWSVVPPAGTPGAKQMLIDVELTYGDGSLSATLRASGLQKAAAARSVAPGGFLIIQGRLADGGRRLVEAGAVYQGPKQAA